MKNPYITFKDGKAYAVDMPESPIPPDPKTRRAYDGQMEVYDYQIKEYESEVKSAIENAALFEDQDEMVKYYHRNFFDINGNIFYPLPEGYSVEIGINCYEDCEGKCGECSKAIKTAKLVKK